ncbi:hypothetical protein GCM10023188_32830 [Pontibacter saemangeumensis]|uniref:PA14 domain-containing protein n=1 Tax=Pontibacter saemangeumensis TaxID=1084525 RepID=A0ABP8LWZ4_9BACT
MPVQKKEQIVYSGPIVITKRGTYTGNWESRDSNVSAVEVTTSEPVIIENSNIRGAGRMIRSAGHGAANITVRNTNAYGLAPTPWHDYKRTRYFVAVDEFTNIVVENCYIEGAAGINLGGRYLGDGTPAQSIRIRYNKARNIDGRIYGGVAGVCFVGLNFRNPVRHAEIAWNQVINEPGNSVVEDNINLSNSRGTPDSPIRVHDNYIQGAHPLDPRSGTYSGGGIIADSWWQQGMGDPSDVATAHVKVYGNQTVNLSNYNYAIAGGNNIEIYNNRAVTSALLPDGTPVSTHNIGLYGYDYYKTGATHSNAVHHNLTGVMGTYAHQRNDAPYFPDGTVAAYDNATLPQGTITKTHEQQEYQIWQGKLSQNGIVLGPFVSSASIAPANQAPTVAITSPKAGASLAENTTLEITVSAQDADGSVAKVEFYHGTTKLGEALASPFSFACSNLLAGSYVLTAKATDKQGAATTSAAVSITITKLETISLLPAPSEPVAGKITREYWAAVTGSGLSAVPVTKAPTSAGELTLFEAPTNVADNYGQRIRGYVTAPVSGEYTFWIAGDDNAVLYLSTSDNPTDKKQIAYVNGWTYSREWSKYTSQQSVKVPLEAGRRYYIEALHLEMGGGDNLAVGWQLPNGAKEMPIAGGRLSPISNTFASTSNLQAAETSETASFITEITAYPNPFSDVLTMNTAGLNAELKEVVLLDQTGRVVYKQQDLLPEDNKLAINLSDAGLTSGLYFLRYNDAAGNAKSIKVIKQ